MSSSEREIKRVAILNRGEPATRFCRALKDYNHERGLEIKSVALYTTPDQGALFTSLADEQYHLGPAMIKTERGLKSPYLDFERVRRALEATQCDTIWPGWGFASEDASFVRAVEQAGIRFLGPSAEAMERLGDKLIAKELAEQSGVPLAPWCEVTPAFIRASQEGDERAFLREMSASLDQIGFPLMVKASAGGGGRGIRKVNHLAELRGAIREVQAEVEKVFGGGKVFLEACINQARHIEVQFLRSRDQRAIALGTRDCSIQRRHQKVIEEAPAPELPQDVEDLICESAARLAEVSDYCGVGTAEFLYQPGSRRAYFMEVNARLQVEHTVTECVTQVDLIHAQLDIARGRSLAECGALNSRGETAQVRGYSIQARLCAEDVARGFIPAPGQVIRFRPPTGPGIRVDSGVVEGAMIASDFDSMIAKIIASGSTRAQATARLKRALEELQIVVEDGTTNKSLLLELVSHPRFKRAELDIGWLDRSLAADELGQPRRVLEALSFAAIVEYHRRRREDVRAFFSATHSGVPRVPPPPEPIQVDLSVGSSQVSLRVHNLGGARYLVGPLGEARLVELTFDRDLEISSVAEFWFDDTRLDVFYTLGERGVTVEVDGAMHTVELASDGALRAPMPALVVELNTAVGQRVAIGDRLLTLEAMKLEMPVVAQEAGIVRSILCAPNAQVKTGEVLIKLDPVSASEDLSNSSSSQSASDSLSQRWARRNAERFVSRLTTSRSHGEELCLAIRAALLGYDMSHEVREVMLSQVRESLHRLDRQATVDLLSPERLSEWLRCFAEIQTLFDRTPRLEGASTVSDHSLFFETCRLSRRGLEGASSSIRDSLERALAWYGSPSKGAPLRGALYRLYVAYTHHDLRHELCSLLLRALMSQHHAGVSFGRELSEHLDVIRRLSEPQHSSVIDNAAQAKYLLFVQPRYALRRQALEERLRSHLSVLDQSSPEGEAEGDQGEVTWMESLIEAPEAVSVALLSNLRSTRCSGGLGLSVLMRRTYGPLDCVTDEPLYLDEVWEVRASVNIQRPREVDTSALKQTGAVPNIERETGEVMSVCALLLSPNTLGLHGQVLSDLITTLNRWGEAQREGLTSAPQALDIFLTGPPAVRDLERCIESRLDELLTAVFQAAGDQCQRVTFAWVSFGGSLELRTYLSSRQEETLLRGIHPAFARRFELHRLRNFNLTRLPTEEPVYAYLGSAPNNVRDERVFAFGCLRSLPTLAQLQADPSSLSHLEHAYYEALRVVREAQTGRDQRRRLQWNRLTLYVREPAELTYDEICTISQRLNSAASGLGLEKVVVRARLIDVDHPQGLDTAVVVARPGKHRLQVSMHTPSMRPVRTLSDFELGVVRARRLGLVYPYELIHLLTGERSGSAYALPHPHLRTGTFVEHELDETGEELIPVERPYGLNPAAVVVGLITNPTDKHPEGMTRVIIINDPTRAMCALAEPECRRVLAALKLARRREIPIEWVSVSAGAKIAMDSGTENLDWTARVLRELITYTQEGGVAHVIVAGVNVGAQSYWNAEATMLMHTKGLLIMTERGSCVLTGKKALEVSGSVAAEDERGIGGWERVMGPNGQAQIFAKDLAEAYHMLMEHYRFTWVKPGEETPRDHETQDPRDRNICVSPYLPSGRDPQEAGDFQYLGEIFSQVHNPGRKRPFDIRAVMDALIDQDGGKLERFTGMSEGETSVIWDAHLGGAPICLIGIESRPMSRRGRIPPDGPDAWAGGTLFPQSSKKVARALNAASGVRPVVVLANLSGFDGSPESLRRLQLEYGAEIGRAVTNFAGQILFVVIGRYHGGAYVVFSKALNAGLTALALTGSYASVIGGGPAATVVFPREVKSRVASDPRVSEVVELLRHASVTEQPRLRERLERLSAAVTLEVRGQVADEFDQVHTVARAVEVGSLDAVIDPAELRPELIKRLKGL